MGGYELQKQKQSQKIAKLNKSNDSLKWTCLKKVNIRKKDNNNTCINNNTSVHTSVIMASFWDERKKIRNTIRIINGKIKGFAGISHKYWLLIEEFLWSHYD